MSIRRIVNVVQVGQFLEVNIEFTGSDCVSGEKWHLLSPGISFESSVQEIPAGATSHVLCWKTKLVLRETDPNPLFVELRKAVNHGIQPPTQTFQIPVLPAGPQTLPPLTEAQPKRELMSTDTEGGSKKAKERMFTTVGAVVAMLFVAGGLVWWLGDRSTISTEPETPAPAVAALSEALPEAEVPARIPQEEQPEAAPIPVPTTNPQAKSAPAPAAGVPDPTGCMFVNTERPKVGEKYILRCADGKKYLATGKYDYGKGNFDFSEFEEYETPK